MKKAKKRKDSEYYISQELLNEWDEVVTYLRNHIKWVKEGGKELCVKPKQK